MAHEGVEVYIYHYSDWSTPKQILNNAQDPKFLEELAGTGQGSFTIYKNDPKLLQDPTLLKSRNIAKVKVDGKVVGAFMMKYRTAKIIADGEKSAEAWEISGPGLKCWFDDTQVQPFGGLQPNSRDSRSFSFATLDGPWYKASEWKNPYRLGRYLSTGLPNWRNLPTKWPDGLTYAQWIWGTAGADDTADEGDNYFRINVPITSEGTYQFWIATDDAWILFLDGEQVGASDVTSSAHIEAKKVDLDMTEGDHVIGIQATNWKKSAGVIAGLLADIPARGANDHGLVQLVVRKGKATRVSSAGHRHNLHNGNKVYFTSSENMPNGIKENTNYYVVNARSNEFMVSTKVGGSPIKATMNTDGTVGARVYLAPVAASTQPIWWSGISLTEMTTELSNQNHNVAVAQNEYDHLPEGSTADKASKSQKEDAKEKANGLALLKKAQAKLKTVQAAYNVASRASSLNIITKCQAYPDQAPGWTPGDILLTLIQEAEDREVDFPNYLVPTFTSDVDSNGVAWPEPIPWTFDVGTKLSDVVSQLEEVIADIWIDPDTFKLYAVAQRGVDRTVPIGTVSPVVFRKAQNLRAAQTTATGKIVNSLSIKTIKGWMDYQQSGSSIDEFGAIEDKLDTGANEAVSIQLANAVFAQKQVEEEGATYDVYIADGRKTPWIHFFPGDWVLAPNAQLQEVKRRIMSISVQTSTTGRPLYTLEFDTIFQTSEARLEAAIKNNGGGGLGGAAASGRGSGIGTGTTIYPPAAEPAPAIPQAPTGVTGFSIGDWDAMGVRAISTATISWDDVVLNTDGSDTVPIRYDVWGHDSAQSDNTYQNLATTLGETTTTIGLGFNPGSSWTFQVYAYNANGLASDASVPFVLAMLGPDEPMLAPSDPDLSSEQGLLIAHWDGLMSDGTEPELRFRYIYAEWATDPLGPWSRGGNALQRGGGNVMIAGLSVGTTYYVHFIAVDGVGIASVPSGGPSNVLRGIDLGPLQQDLDDALAAVRDAVTDVRQSVNMLEDNGFESNTEDYWNWDNTHVTNSTNNPRTGTRNLRVTSSGSTFEALRYVSALKVDPGDSYYFKVYVALESGTTADDGDIAIRFLYGPDPTTGAGYAEIGSSAGVEDDFYVPLTGTWLVPEGVNYFRPQILINDTDSGNVYNIDDIRILKMDDETTIVDGTIVTDKLAAEAVVTEKLAANSVATEKLQAGAVITEKLEARAVTTEKLDVDAVQANNIKAGAVQTSHLSPSVGNDIDISANDTVTIIAGQVQGVSDAADAVSDGLDAMQTYYSFGPNGALISTPASPFAVAIDNDSIDMLENGNVVSYWNSGTLFVDQLVGSQVVLGSHQLEAYGNGTVVRAV